MRLRTASMNGTRAGKARDMIPCMDAQCRADHGQGRP